MDNYSASQSKARTSKSPLDAAVSLPRKFFASGWVKVAQRIWKQSSEDNIGLVAAGVAFYTFLALVPLLGAIVLSYGLIAAPSTVLTNVQSLTTVMPAGAAKLVGKQLMSVLQTSAGKKGMGLLLALAIALFGARNAAGSVITALNIAYEVQETRGLVRLNFLALVTTASAIVLAILAMIAIAALGYLGKLLPHLPTALLLASKMGPYLLLLIGAAVGAAALYRYGPDREKGQWVWIDPGSILASVGWVTLTLGFGFYAANFGNYGKTYGSLATVIVLLTWIYLSVYVLLLGAELNSELGRQASRGNAPRGSKESGPRSERSADNVRSNQFGKGK